MVIRQYLGGRTLYKTNNCSSASLLICILSFTHGGPNSFKLRPIQLPVPIFTKFFITNPALYHLIWYLIQVQVCPKSNFRPIFTKLDTNPTIRQPFLKMYLIQVQVCPKYNFLIPRPIFTKFAINTTLLRTDSENVQLCKMYLISGSVLSHEAGAEPASNDIKTRRKLPHF